LEGSSGHASLVANPVSWRTYLSNDINWKDLIGDGIIVFREKEAKCKISQLFATTKPGDGNAFEF